MWEYKIEPSPSEDRLNELARDGWEMVSCDGGRCYLRRPLRPSQNVNLPQRVEPEAGSPRREHFETPKKSKR